MGRQRILPLDKETLQRAKRFGVPPHEGGVNRCLQRLQRWGGFSTLINSEPGCFLFPTNAKKKKISVMTTIHSFILTHTQKSPLRVGHFIQLCFRSGRLGPLQTTSPSVCLLSKQPHSQFLPASCLIHCPMLPDLVTFCNLEIMSSTLTDNPMFSTSIVCVILPNGCAKHPPLSSKFQQMTSGLRVEGC